LRGQSELKARKSERGWGSRGGAVSHLAKGSGDRSKLPVFGPGRSPGRQEFGCILRSSLFGWALPQSSCCAKLWHMCTVQCL